MPETQKTKQYDLEERTYTFAKNITQFLQATPNSFENVEFKKQLIRSAGSVAANYIEANEALSKKDFLMRIKIARKEAKESELWLRLLELKTSEQLEKGRTRLTQEALELRKIFGAILEKSK